MSDQHRQPTGSEPLTARSPLRLRAVMSGIALVAAVAAGVVFAVLAITGREPGAGPWVVVAICAVVAIIAVVDLWVIRRRARSRSGGGEVVGP